MIITITDDFDLDRIAESGQCFRWNKTEESEYRIIAGQSCMYIIDLSGGRYEISCTEDEYKTVWHDYFDLTSDYGNIRTRINPEEDPFLWRASEHEKGIRILRQDPWETLITFIISQNRNIPGIRHSVELLAEACGEKKTDSRGQFYYTFPDPWAVAALSEPELMSCKLGYRWKYVQKAAKAVVEGEINLDLLYPADEKTVIATLTGLYGVGKKVASCVSLFGLHHMDAFPVDVWIKRILVDQYPNGYPYERYAPYNGICQQYMFAYYRHTFSGTAENQLP